MQADWIETSCLFGRDISVSKPDVSVALENSGDFDEGQIARIIEDAFAEINRRKNILAKNFAFEVDQNKIRRLGHWWEFPAYSFMLLLSTNYFDEHTKLTNENRGTPAKLFEGLTTLALNKYLPAAINIGWPRLTTPKDLSEALDFFCRISKERMREEPEIADQAKDEDVDVIAWSPIDSRPGQVILLVQCTIEKDWRKSGSKIDIATWKNIMNFTTPPRKALAFPQVCGLAQWKYQSTKCGILFDRLRLASLFPADKTICLSGRIIEWSIKQAENLRWFV
jgi:hypothetical protein